jgi:putative sterol carrier protein
MRVGREVAVAAPARLEDIFSDAPVREAMVRLPDDVSVTFDLAGDGGGTWTVSRSRGRTAVKRADSEQPDCRIVCSVGDFQALVRGDLDARHAFLAGRLGVEGDVGLALRLQRVSR